jgi:putative endonuclease
MVIKRGDEHYLYILQCKDGSYYTGYAKNLRNRIKLHNQGNGAKCLRGKLPVELVYAKKYKYCKDALDAERNIKKLNHNQKEEFVNTHAKYKPDLCLRETNHRFTHV